jgi:hypothetical protein
LAPVQALEHVLVLQGEEPLPKWGREPLKFGSGQTRTRISAAARVSEDKEGAETVRERERDQ